MNAPGISISEDAWKRINDRKLSLYQVFRILFYPQRVNNVNDRVHLSSGMTTIVTNATRDYIITVKSNRSFIPK